MHHIGSESQNGHYVTEVVDDNPIVMDDMTDRSIEWLRDCKTAMPDIAAFCCVGVRPSPTSNSSKKVSKKKVRDREEHADAPGGRNVRQRTTRTQKRGGVGGVLRPRRVNLVNVGNSCYMNTMLFVFCHIPRIISFYDLDKDPTRDREGHVERVTAKFIRYAYHRLNG